MTAPYRTDAREPALISWSGGKDSCLALHDVIEAGVIRVEALVTTITRDFDRISMHGVRRTLLERQAQSLGLPLETIDIGKGATNEEYESSLLACLRRHADRDIHTMVFGDLFLEDIRAYRDRLLEPIGFKGLYPVWQRDTDALIRRFLALGYRTAIVCVDPARLDPAFVGRVLDEQFLADLPRGVDPCGENGEFHTFVFDGPLFRSPVSFVFGETVERDGFCFCDLVPEA